MSTLSTNDKGKSFWELVYGSVNQVLADHHPAVLYDVVHFPLLCKEYLTLVLKNCRLLFSAVISEHFSKNRMIISAVAAKIWYLKNVRFLLGHPVDAAVCCLGIGMRFMLKTNEVTDSYMWVVQMTN